VIGVVAVPIGSECITAWHGAVAAGDIVATKTSSRGVGQDIGSCFHSLYVQWLESAGARVVPIPYDVPAAELDHLLDSLNGVMFTGGEVELHNLTSPYMNTARRIVSRSVSLATKPQLRVSETGQMTAATEQLPVWGTCMGFQTLLVLAAEDPAILTEGAFDSESLSLPLELTAAGRASRLWGALRPQVQAVLEGENVTCNLHHDGVFAADFEANPKVAAAYTMVSTNRDRRNQTFASTIEHREAPVCVRAYCVGVYVCVCVHACVR
jgi:gamma-glutamyl hydrolase